MPLEDPSPSHAIPAEAARTAEVARRERVIRDGLDGVAAWEAANGALTDEEMAVARLNIADEVAMLRAIAAWGAAEDWTDWAETAG